MENFSTCNHSIQQNLRFQSMKYLCCTSTCVLLLLNGWFQWVGGCLKEEREALLLLRDSAVPLYNGSNPMSSWKGEDCCRWDIGIKCSISTRQVVGIYIKDIDLSAFVNYSLFAVFKQLTYLTLDGVQITGAGQMLDVTCKLKHLKALDLGGNSIQTSIPPCLCENHSLKKLNLQSTHLKGSIPSCLANMKSLALLDLSGNQFEGNVPSFFGNMKSLEYLDLSHNQFQGKIPCLANLKSLKYLDLSYNQLKGKIPSCLGNMSSLQNLHMQFNQLTGNFDHSLFLNLTRMESIHISNNQFSGIFSFSVLANLSKLFDVDLSNNVQLEVDTESPTWVPTFQLRFLDLANCNLNMQTGFFPNFISSQHKLYTLDLSHNSLEGKIPDWLLYNTSLMISLRGNNLVGPLPLSHVQNVTVNLAYLDISDTRFTGTLSANNVFLLSNTLQSLNMSSNALVGEIPRSMNFLKDQLRALDLSNNRLSGEIPHWLAANNSVLKVLILSNNKFQGEMLPKDSNMENLLVLRLDGNDFTGSIPGSLMNSKKLMILDVGENNMSGDISNWFPMPSQLKVLFLRSNNLQGHIPREMCLLQHLRYLDLSGNLLSGDIPSCIFNITSMVKENYKLPRSYLVENLFLNFTQMPIEIHFNTKGASHIFKGKPVIEMIGIDLSINQLTGSIPIEMGYLEGLHSLNLSHNSLIGPIPTSFGHLKSLECLDLSYNHINGTIPLEMVGLNSLAMVNVSFNNLSGEIPSDGHFLTLNDPTSYMGNPGLCGKELEKHCLSNNETPIISHDKDEDEERHSIMDSSLTFYSSVTISYILGFWGFIGLLIFKKNWRQKFFKSADVLLEGCLTNYGQFTFT